MSDSVYFDHLVLISYLILQYIIIIAIHCIQYIALLNTLQSVLVRFAAMPL